MKKLATILTAAVTLIGGEFFNAPALHADSLENALRASLSNSKDLAAARQEWIAARENIGSKTATSDLSARLNSTANQSHIDSRAGAGFEQSQSISADITLSKNLYDGGQTKQNMRLAEIELRTASATFAKAEQKLILETVESYLAVIKARREVNLHVANLKRLEAHVSAAKIRLEAGASTPTRLAEARARLARARSDSISAQTRLINAEDAYQSLTGMGAGTLSTPAMDQGLPTSLDQAENTARKAHPDIAAALSAERAANQRFNTLKAAVSPTLAFSLTASSKAATGTNADKDDVTAKLVFSSPILSTNATRASSRRIAASHSRSQLKYKEAIRLVEVGARKAFRNWQATETRLDAVRSEIDASRLVAKGIASEAQYGQKTNLDLLDAEQDVNDAELRLVTVEHDRLQAAYRLLAAIGRLSAADLGLNSVVTNLDDLPAPQNPFSSTFPFSRRQMAD